MSKKMKKVFSVEKMIVLAMLAAFAYVVMFVGRVPVVLFLKYDPKDVVIVMSGFIFGPFSAFIVSVVVSFIEMFTASDTGWVGFVMNVISTCSFACTAAIIYQIKKSLKFAVLGLIAGVITMVIVMIAWNYFLTPIFMKIPPSDVLELLIPVFLPFNLLKGVLNAAITMLLYKPLTSLLRRMRLMPNPTSGGLKINIPALIISSFAVITCILFIILLRTST
ncbi:MAG: ECF transporter S component [Oscillospiraceae bacterium]|nr:ECF transporter S component [Oscillospiraceae bacterium]